MSLRTLAEIYDVSFITNERLCSKDARVVLISLHSKIYVYRIFGIGQFCLKFTKLTLKRKSRRLCHYATCTKWRTENL